MVNLVIIQDALKQATDFYNSYLKLYDTIDICIDRNYASELDDQTLEQYNITASQLQDLVTLVANFTLFLDNQTPNNADYRKTLNIIRTDK